MLKNLAILNRITCTLVIFITTGCTTILYPRQDLSPAAAANLKNISLLRVDEPDRFEPPIFANAALGVLGPIGVIAVGAVLMKQIEERTVPFTKAMHQEEASFSDILVAGITTAASNRGLEMKYLQGNRPSAVARGSFDYSSIPRSADTFLHVKIDTIGCRHDSAFGGNCFPIIQVTARLIESGTGEVLFLRTVCAGHGSPEKDKEVIFDDQEPSFENFAAVMTNPKSLAEALRVRARALASHLVSLLH